MRNESPEEFFEDQRERELYNALIEALYADPETRNMLRRECEISAPLNIERGKSVTTTMVIYFFPQDVLFPALKLDNDFALAQKVWAKSKKVKAILREFWEEGKINEETPEMSISFPVERDRLGRERLPKKRKEKIMDGFDGLISAKAEEGCSDSDQIDGRTLTPAEAAFHKWASERFDEQGWLARHRLIYDPQAEYEVVVTR